MSANLFIPSGLSRWIAPLLVFILTMTAGAYKSTPLQSRFPILCQSGRLLIISILILASWAHAESQPAWVPGHFSLPSDSISPDGRYGIMVPDSETNSPDKLVEMKTGRVVTNLAGSPGWRGGPGRSMRWGEMEASWSADSSTLCWIHPDKWFFESYVVLKLEKGQLAWQVELMKRADREILARTEATAPLNFAIAKLDNDGNGSVYPEGFSIGVSKPGTVSLPLVSTVTLTSNIKGDKDEPEKDGVRAWLTMTVETDGSLTYSDFKVKQGRLSSDAEERVKSHAVHFPLVDTDLGKALLFPGLESKDGQFAVGWTIRAAREGNPPVDWTHWDPINPDKVLRLYDWQDYDDEDKASISYQAVDFVLNTHSGKTVMLSTTSPNWPWKRDDWQMHARWYNGTNGTRYGLIMNGQGNLEAGNFWLVNLGDSPMQAQDLAVTMRKAINNLLRERRPEVAAREFMVSYPLQTGEESAGKREVAQIPFVADAPSSDQGEFQLSGTVTIRLADGMVVGVSSDMKRLEPFVTNEALRKADDKLNTIFQAKLKTLSRKDAEALRQKERDWIAKRDGDASQAVNIMSEGSTQEACERAREDSLLESTRKRIQELEGQTR